MFSMLNRAIKRAVLRQQKKKPIVLISDTTLRDGLQMPGLRLTPQERVPIAQALADAGVHSIDCGFPAASEDAAEGIRRIARQVRGPVLSALARSRTDDIDRAAEALSGVSPLKRSVTIFIGTSPLHRKHKHEMSKAQIVDAAVKAVQHAQRSFEIISFGPEDASRTEPEFLYEVYEKVIQAGALSIGFTDTVGILTPGKAADAVRGIQDHVRSIDDAMLGVHFHDDLGMATANALACVEAGANIVQGTVNGIGERAGNTAIEEVVLALVLHFDQYQRKVSVDPGRLHALSQLVQRLTGFETPPNKAIVGRNLFRTEAGIHQDGVLQNADTYTPFPPELVGAGPVQVVLGPNSGRAAVRHHLLASGVEVNDETVEQVMSRLKNGSPDEAESAEISAFMERLRPFIVSDEFVHHKNGARGGSHVESNGAE